MYALRNSTIYTGTSIEHRKAILIDENNIIDIINEKDLPTDIKCYNLNGLNLAPGFIDLQVYGGGDILFSVNPTVEALQKISESFQKVGTTRFLITIPTSSPETISACIKATKEYLDGGGVGLLGLHLEGPFINSEKKGAHIEQYIQPISLADLKKLVEEADGVVKMITLAPEQCNAECIEFLQENNIVISAGHSNATYKQATEAFNLGVKTCTHLFNAMSGFAHREPGLVGAIYDSDHVQASIIPDGFHADFAAVRISKKIMNDRLFIITDAVVENLEGDFIYKKDTGKFVDGKGTLAGSALTMIQGIKNCIEKADIDVDEAIRMATFYPAKVLGLDHHLGKVATGFAADFVIFDDNYNVHNIVAEGKFIAID
ncbi:N-acetylglucosamine-6-phosphate deacetylase [Solitalea sp. MAHUQ-68]|uniref:N-acetylglucosamine-6-phosphate deacetylase n=1 Tax=Solitalea agri TaxID=2953739 RepID=A0A9X2F023_9SPHI|nr:N-acetylglucosamine-6-phosphate deacetylase [Solitalea agri]MCO4291630.1 N-acetylglucosamine-6-phosphate deacetylase [Solitalea agri]